MKKYTFKEQIIENEYKYKYIFLCGTEVERLLKKVHLKLNDRKTELYNLSMSNHVRITGVSVTKDSNNFRHISVGKKLKNEIFWDAINFYDQEIKDYTKIAHLKGIYSFVLSIEKNGIDDCYSDKMKELINARGYENLKQLINSLGKSTLDSPIIPNADEDDGQ